MQNGKTVVGFPTVILPELNSEQRVPVAVMEQAQMLLQHFRLSILIFTFHVSCYALLALCTHAGFAMSVCPRDSTRELLGEC